MTTPVSTGVFFMSNIHRVIKAVILTGKGFGGLL